MEKSYRGIIFHRHRSINTFISHGGCYFSPISNHPRPRNFNVNDEPIKMGIYILAKRGGVNARASRMHVLATRVLAQTYVPVLLYTFIFACMRRSRIQR